MDKTFLSSDLDVFKAFQLLLRHGNTKIMHDLEVFTTEVYIKKQLKVTILKNYGQNIYLQDLTKKDIKNESANVKNRKQKSVFEKMSPTCGAFHQNIKSAYLQSLIFHEADKAVIEMKNTGYFGWKFDGTHYIAIVTDNSIAPESIISYQLCIV